LTGVEQARAALHARDPREIVLHSPMSLQQRLAVALCCAMLAIDGYDLLAVTFAMPGISAEWGTTKTVLGGLFSTGIIGMAAGCLIFGPLADKIGRRPMAIGSLILMTIGMSFSALAANIEQLMFWRLFTGVGIGAAVAVAYPLSVEYSSLRARPVTLALMVISFPLGGAVGGVAATNFMELMGWRGAFLTGVIAPLIITALCLRWLPEPLGLLIERPRPSSLKAANRYLQRIGRQPLEKLPPPRHPGRTPVGRVLGKEFRAVTGYLAAIYCLYSLTAYFLLAWLPQIVTDLGFPPSVAATVSVSASIGGIGGAALTGLAIRKIGLFPILLTLLLGLALSMVMIGLAPRDILALRAIGITAGIFVYGPIVGMTLLIAEEYPVEVRATGTGFIIGLSRWSAAVGPLVGGILISSRLGTIGSCVLMGLIALLTTGLFAYFHINHRSVRPAPLASSAPSKGVTG
jgi:MFS family permease